MRTETDQRIKDINDMFKMIKEEEEGQKIINYVWEFLIRVLPLKHDKA